MNKKAIAILGAIFLLIVGTLGFLLYQRQHKKNLVASQTQQQQQDQVQQTDNTTTPPANTTPNQTPDSTPSGQAIKLSDDQVISPILFYQGNGITYFNNSGQLFQADLVPSDTGLLLSNKRELTIALKSNISKILWPLAGNNFIAEFNSGGSRTWSFYNSSAGNYTDLPNQIESLDWMPSGDKIIFVWVDANGKATLNTSNPDGSNYQYVTNMYEADDQITVAPDGKSLLFWRTHNNDAKNIISLLSPDGKFYKAVVPDGYNTDAKWSPDSHLFLFARRDSQGGFQLWEADVYGGTIKNLNVNTVPDKCVWAKDSQTVYCAVPTKGTLGQGLTEDEFVRLNVSSTDKKEFTAGTAVDGEDLFLSSDEKSLFFKNNQDQALYYIDVSQ